MEEFKTTFEKLSFRTEGMNDTFFQEFFINGLKDDIRVQVLMTHPHTWLEATQCDKESQQVVFSQHHKPSFPLHPDPPTTSLYPTPLKIKELSRAEMFECQIKCLCYNCDEKYFPRHKFKK